MRVDVIGGGPAGASLAWFLRGRGLDIRVYDMSRVLGLKPCGGAVPVAVEEYLRVPGDSIVSRLRGHRVYLDNKLLFENYGGLWGYIIDKKLFLEKLVEDSGAHVARGVVASSDPVGYVQGDSPEYLRVVATGSYWSGLSGSRINAVQFIIEGHVGEEYEGIAELHFDSRFVGYYWVFPDNPGRLRVGVGGFKSFAELISMLRSFTSKWFAGFRIIDKMGSRIYIGGLREDLLDKNLPIVGEALGAVYPLSGEGIRPAIITSWALAEAIKTGKPYREVLRRTLLPWRISIHEKILNVLVRRGAELRASLLKTLSPEDSIRLGLGYFDKKSLVSILARYPGLAVKALRLLVG